MKMRKLFSCWSRKNNNKDPSSRKVRSSIIYVDTGPDLGEVVSNYRKMPQNLKPSFRSSDSLSRDPNYLRRLFGQNSNRKIRSYPSSPRKEANEGSGYLSDQKPNHTVVDTNAMPYKKSALVYAASVPQSSAQFKPREEEESNEPFPFQIPQDPLPRRSTMYYGVEYDRNPLDPSEIPRYAAEKPIEDYDMPSTSQGRPSILHKPQQDNDGYLSEGRRVTIDTTSPLDDGNIVYFDNKEEDEDVKTEPVRRTVVRLRPNSQGSYSPNESVKYMTVRPDSTLPPLIMGKYVHNIPFKPSKNITVLETVDGRRLLPVQKDQNKIRRVSLKTEKESQPVRLSLVEPTGESENLGTFAVQREENPVVYEAPVVHSRPSVGRPSVRPSVVLRESVERPSVRQSMLMRESVGRPSVRQSMLLRESVGRPSVRQSMLLRESVRRPSVRKSVLLRESVDRPSVRKSVLLRESVDRPSVRQSVVLRESVGRRRYSEDKEENLEERENQAFPFVQDDNRPMVFAVPVVPTRGRTKSILEQSVKSLSSKQMSDKPAVYRKNIRYSMDTDVFSAEPRHGSTTPNSSGYVNMEKGQTVLVSDVLNPITSLFVSDLKDAIPKDPITKPREGNVWVKPRVNSAQRRSLFKQPEKQVPRVQVVYKEQPVAPSAQRGRSKTNKYRNESSSSSEDSIEVYSKKSKRPAQKGPYRQQQHAVYAAEIPNVTLPDPSQGKKKHSLFKKKGKSMEARPSSSKDYCGLACETPEDQQARRYQPLSNVEVVSSGQQTDDEDDIELFCYPSEKFLRKSTGDGTPDSKSTWRIIIKRGEDK